MVNLKITSKSRQNLIVGIGKNCIFFGFLLNGQSADLKYLFEIMLMILNPKSAIENANTLKIL
jgi:hypothetical protein